METLLRRRKGVATATVLGLSLLATGCGRGDSLEKNRQRSTPTYQEVCAPSNARPLPTATNVTKVRDSRFGKVYACEYFLDEQIPFNTPLKLLKITERDSVQGNTNFQATGNLGGVAVLGFGAISGDYQASGRGRVEERRVVATKFFDSTQSLRSVTVDLEKTRIRPCTTKDCEPTIEFKIPNQALWDKGDANKDTSSIWMFDCHKYKTCPNDDFDTAQSEDRRRVVSEVATHTPTDVGEHFYKGGPDTIGQVLSALSSEIVLVLPPSDIQ